MQMAKTSAALARMRSEGIPYVSVLTHPTTGGVSASLGMLGDINIGEPKALIGFAGPRVIEQTVRETLPEGFQRSEFLLEHGAIDMIVDRRQMREKIAAMLALMTQKPIAAYLQVFFRAARLRYLIPFALGFASLNLAAKCQAPIYEVVGVVTDAIGRPANHASVAVAWMERGHIYGPAIGITDERGRYAIRFRFSKWSGNNLLFGERCDGRVGDVTVSAYSENMRSDSLRISAGETTTIVVPALALGYRSD
jgi:hypothetical protein